MLINNCFINVNIYEPKENIKDTTIIFTHGLGEYSKSYIETAEYFKNNGFNVITYDIRGHGKSGGKRGSVKSYRDFISDLKELVNFSYKKTKKVFLVGHSMGGIITNLYASIYNDIDGVIITASPTTYMKNLNGLKYLPKFLLNKKKFRTNFSDEKLTHNNNYVVDGYDLNYFYFKLVNEMLIKGIKKLIKNYNKYESNILMIYSKNDLLGSVEYGELFYSKIKSEDKELFILEESRHNVFNDIEKEKVWHKILDWINERL